MSIKLLASTTLCRAYALKVSHSHFLGCSLPVNTPAFILSIPFIIYRLWFCFSLISIFSDWKVIMVFLCFCITVPQPSSSLANHPSPDYFDCLPGPNHLHDVFMRHNVNDHKGCRVWGCMILYNKRNMIYIALSNVLIGGPQQVTSLSGEDGNLVGQTIT